MIYLDWSDSLGRKILVKIFLIYKLVCLMYITVQKFGVSKIS